MFIFFLRKVWVDILELVWRFLFCFVMISFFFLWFGMVVLVFVFIFICRKDGIGEEE